MSRVRAISEALLSAVCAAALVPASRACPFCYEGRASGDLFCTGLHEWRWQGTSYGWYWEWRDGGGYNWYYHGVDGYDWYDAGLTPLGVWSPVKADVPAQDNPMPAQATSRDPVNLLTGRVTDSAADLELPSPLAPLAFSRHYVSGTDGDAALGRGWRHSLDVRVCATTNGTPFLSRPDGTAVPFASTSGTGRDWRSLGDADCLLVRGTNGVWTLDAFDAGSAAFTTNGLLSSVSDRRGNTLSLVRGAGGRLERVERGGETALSLSYSPDGRISRVSTPEPSYFAEYGHDADGNLSLVRVHAGGAVSETRYACGPRGLTNRVNAAGEASAYAYRDAPGEFDDGLATAAAFGAGLYAHSVSYHTNAWVESGRWVDYWDERGGFWGWDWEDTSHFEPCRRAVATYLRDGVPLAWEYRRMDGARWLASATTPEGETTSYDVDSSGRLLGWARTNGRLSESVSLDYGWTPHPVSWRHSYGGATARLDFDRDAETGRLLAVSDGAGGRTELSYAADGLVSEARRLADGTNAVATRVERLANGLPSAVLDARGGRTSFARDARGNATSVVLPDGASHSFGYDALNRLVSWTSPGGATTRRTVAPDGRVERTDYPDGTFETAEHDALRRPVRLVDRAGRVLSVAYAAGGLATNAVLSRAEGGTNAVLLRLSVRRDTQLNVVRADAADGSAAESYALDGQDRVVAVTNAEGRAAEIVYALGDRVARVRRFDGTEVSLSENVFGVSRAAYPSMTNDFAYAADGRLVSASGPGGTVSFACNRLGLATNAVSPAGTVEYAYDAAGGLAAKRFLGCEILYARDAMGRATNLVLRAGGAEFAFALSYAPGRGVVASARFPNGLVRRTSLDCMGRVASVVHEGRPEWTWRYERDALDCATDVARGDGARVEYAYDGLGRLAGETAFGADGRVLRSASFARDARGNLVRRSTARGALSAEVSYAAGAGDRLASWSASASGAVRADVVAVSDEPVGTGRLGRLRVEVDGAAAEGVSVSGNAVCASAEMSVGRPHAVSAAVPDAAGNVGAATNLVSVAVVTNAVYAWDAAGCLANRVCSDSSGGAEAASYSWTDDCRLARVATNGAAACSFGYDALGNMAAFSNAAGRVAFLVEDGHVLADVGADGTPLRVYVRTEGVDGWLGFVDLAGGAPRGRWFVADAFGSVRAVMDDGGEVVERYDYDAWGRVLRVEGADGAALARSAVGNRILWQGREWFPDAGLHFFRERWYDPVVGRWVSEDPIGLAGGLNLYEFCGGDPVNGRDPFGLARIGVRGLSRANTTATLVAIGTYFPWSLSLVEFNMGLYHQHIFFGDEVTSDNVGYFPEGVLADEPKNLGRYYLGWRRYDGDLMRRAVRNVKNSGRWNEKDANLGGYNFFTHNCQDFVSEVLGEYRRLERQNGK